MIWYKFHVGDYITHTLHLDEAEDLAYRRLLDMYYMTEKPIPNDLAVVCKKVRMDIDVVEPVLKEFFEPSVDGWLNQRCEEEIAKYAKFVKDNQEKAKKSVKARQDRAAKKRTSKGSEPTVNQRSTGGEPAGNQTDTETDTEKEKKNTSSTASTRFDDFWTVWPASKRKVARAACQKIWVDRKLDALATEILGHVRAMKQTQQWREGFEPSPKTYLGQSRWLDGNPEGDTTSAPIFAGRRIV